jgi:cobaltochelatase CobN
MFPAQLTLFHAAVQKVASLKEDAEMNPLVRASSSLFRIFGAPSGSYGAGVTQRIDAGDWQSSGELGQTYLEASGMAYAGDGEGVAAQGIFHDHVRSADAFLHIQDHCEVDVLGSLDYAAHEGGFVAAAALLGNEKADLYHADSLDPSAPKVRTLNEECARVLHGRALSPRWLEGQMRHGFRGAGEIANTVDAAFAFAATAGTISSEGLEHLYNAYLGDPAVAGFLARENGAALAAIQSRFKEAIARSLWRPRRNDLSALEAGSSVAS